MDNEKAGLADTKHPEVLSDHSGDEVVWTEAEETTLRHKLDWQTVPIVTLMYLLCFLDRCVA